MRILEILKLFPHPEWETELKSLFFFQSEKIYLHHFHKID